MWWVDSEGTSLHKKDERVKRCKTTAQRFQFALVRADCRTRIEAQKRESKEVCRAVRPMFGRGSPFNVRQSMSQRLHADVPRENVSRDLPVKTSRLVDWQVHRGKNLGSPKIKFKKHKSYCTQTSLHKNYVIRAKKKTGTQEKAGCKERKAPPSESG